MNKTETAFSRVLDVLQKTGEITCWQFEAVKFRLGPRCYYTPDFMVVGFDGSVISFVEIKGPFIREDSRIKFRVAAERYPMFGWEMIMGTCKKGEWGWQSLLRFPSVFTGKIVGLAGRESTAGALRKRWQPAPPIVARALDKAVEDFCGPEESEKDEKP